jgi:hypothetical protein
MVLGKTYIPNTLVYVLLCVALVVIQNECLIKFHVFVRAFILGLAISFFLFLFSTKKLLFYFILIIYFSKVLIRSYFLF